MKLNFVRKQIFFGLILLSFNFLSAQDSTKQVNQNISKDSVSNLSYFVFIGGGKGYCGKAGGNGYAGTLSLVYKSHVFSLCGGGSYTPYNEAPSKPNFFNYGYAGFLFGECVKFKRFFSALSTGLVYSNLDYTETDLLTYAYLKGYSKAGVTIPVELKVAGLITKNFGIGINVSKNFTLTSRYAPLMITVSLVFGKWDLINKG